MTNRTVPRRPPLALRLRRQALRLLAGAVTALLAALLTARDLEPQRSHRGSARPAKGEGADGAACARFPDGPTPKPVRYPGLEGLHADAQTMAMSGGRVLVIGRSTFHTGRDAAGGLRQVIDSVLGLTFDTRRPARDGSFAGLAVPMPFDPSPAIIDWPRAVGLGAGRWGAILPLHDSTKDDRITQGARRVLYAEYGRGGWSRPETLPLPPGAQLRIPSSSRMLRTGEAIWWAIPTNPERTMPQIALYVRRGGRWSYEIVPTNTSSYVQLAPGEGATPVVIVVQGDDRLGIPVNGVVVYERSAGGWARRVHGDGVTDAHHLAVAGAGRGGHARTAWWRPEGTPGAGRRVAEFSAVAPGAEGAIDRYGETVTDVLPVVGEEPDALWLIREQPAPPGPEGPITLLEASGRGVRVHHRFDNPFGGRVHPLRAGDGLVLFGWTLLERDGRPVITSTTLRLSRCASRPP